MRKPRDYDAELRALDDKARRLKTRRLAQLGELVIACGADALPIEQLAGALLATSGADAATKEAWRKRGAGFFQRKGATSSGAASDSSGSVPLDDTPKPA